MILNFFLQGISLLSASTIYTVDDYPELVSSMFKCPNITEDLKVNICRRYLEDCHISNLFTKLLYLPHNKRSLRFKKMSAFLSHLLVKEDKILKESKGEVFEFLYSKTTKEHNHPIFCLLYLKIRADLSALDDYNGNHEGEEIRLALDNDLDLFRIFNISYAWRLKSKYKTLLKSSLQLIDNIFKNSTAIIKRFEAVQAPLGSKNLKIHLLQLGIINNIKLFINLLEIAFLLIKMDPHLNNEYKYKRSKKSLTTQLQNKLADASEKLLYYLMGYDPSFYNHFKYYFCDNYLGSISHNMGSCIDMESYIEWVNSVVRHGEMGVPSPLQSKPKDLSKEDKDIIPDDDYKLYISECDDILAKFLNKIGKPNPIFIVLKKDQEIDGLHLQNPPCNKINYDYSSNSKKPSMNPGLILPDPHSKESSNLKNMIESIFNKTPHNKISNTKEDRCNPMMASNPVKYESSNPNMENSAKNILSHQVWKSRNSSHFFDSTDQVIGESFINSISSDENVNLDEIQGYFIYRSASSSASIDSCPDPCLLNAEYDLQNCSSPWDFDIKDKILNRRIHSEIKNKSKIDPGVRKRVRNQ